MTVRVRVRVNHLALIILKYSIVITSSVDLNVTKILILSSLTYFEYECSVLGRRHEGL